MRQRCGVVANRLDGKNRQRWSIATRGGLAFVLLWALGLMTGLPGPLFAQEEEDLAPRLESSAVMSGVGQYEAKVWGMVQARAENPTQQEQSVLMLHQFDNLPTVQFGAEVWLPPRAERVVQLPVRPGPIPPQAKGIELTTLLVQQVAGSEHQLSRAPGLLPVVQGRPLSSVLGGGDSESAVDAAVAGRESVGLGRRMAYLRRNKLPSIYAAWKGLDCLVLARPGSAADEAQLTAMRQWLVSGGRMWIMLDRCDPVFLERLLGEDWTLHLVDRQTLTSWRITGGYEDHGDSSEQPVDFVRVLPGDFETLNTVNGWPASLRKQVGHGEVVITTLGARAWLTEDGSASEPLRSLADHVYRQRREPPIDAARFEPFLQEQIGYHIISRGPVLGVLGVFCLALLGSGAFLASRHRLEHLAWVGPGLAVLFAAVLFVIGVAWRGQVPLTVASAQFVQIVPRQQHAVIHGLMSIYSPSSQKGLFKATSGGIVWSELPKAPDKPLRTIWTDIDRWYWENFDLPAGNLLNAQFVKSTALDEPTRASVSFGPDGAEIQLTAGVLKDLQDPLLVTPGDRTAAPRRVGDSGRYLVAEEDVLAPGRFIRVGGTLVSETQERRAEIFRHVVEHEAFPARPMLMTWAEPMNLGMRLPEEARFSDSALVAVPLEFTKSPTSGEVRIPSVFLPFQSMSGRAMERMGIPLAPGEPLSAIYNSQTREWVGKISTSASVLLRFPLPEGLEQMNLQSAKLTVRIDAPDRKLSVTTYDRGRLRELESRQGPVGVVRFDLPVETEPTLQPADGAVLVGLKIGSGPGFGTEVSTWNLEQVRLSVVGRISAAQASEQPPASDSPQSPAAQSDN